MVYLSALLDTHTTYRLAGAVISSIIFFGCATPATDLTVEHEEDTEDMPVFTGPAVVEDKNRLAIKAVWEEIPVPVLRGGTPVRGGWRYGPARNVQPLAVTLESQPPLDSIVQLPHRILKPDWALWYAREIDTRGYAWIFVNADDGAQVFQDGVLLTPRRGEFYKLDPSGSTSTLTIRVLNNAMSGGLRDVALYPAAAFEVYETNHAHLLAMKRILYEAMRLDSLSNTQFQQLLTMLQAPTDTSIARTRILFPKTMMFANRDTVVPDKVQEVPFRFTVWGDSQSGWATFQQLVMHMRSRPVDFSVGLGDLVGYGGREHAWLAFAASLQPLLLNHPVYAVAGNHDYDGYYNTLNPLLYKQYTEQPSEADTYFAWQHNGAYFIALDPNRNFPLAFDKQQLDWMINIMKSAAWRDASWRFLLMHQAPYAQGWPGYHGDLFIRRMIDSLAVPYKIDFVLSGHNHDYERLRVDYGAYATQFFIFGGGGGGLEPQESSAYPKMDTIIKAHHYGEFAIDEQTVDIAVYGTTGALLDSVRVER